MKIATLLCFLILNPVYVLAQNEEQILNQFKLKFNNYEKKNEVDSLLYLLSFTFQMKNENDLTKIEKQYFHYYNGLYYDKIQRHDKAISEFKKSLRERKEELNSISLYYDCLYALANVNFTYENWSESYKYSFLAIKYFNSREEPLKCIILHSIIGGYYADRHEYDNAINEYQKGIEIAKKYDNCLSIELYIKQAKRYSDKKDFYKAEKLLNKGLSLEISCASNKYNKLNILKSLYYINIKNKKYKEAILLNKEIIGLESQQYRETRNKKLDSLELYYGAKLKDQKNKELIESNFLKNKILKKQNNLLLLLIICYIIVLAFSFLLFFAYKKLKIKNQELNNTKEIIKLQNIELKTFDLLNQKIFSVISHDFKGPIMTLKLLLGSRLSEQVNDKFSKYIADITNQLEYCDNMLNSLLDWAKAEIQIDNTSFTAIDITETITPFISEILTNANNKNIKIINNLPKNVFIHFNVSILRIVFRNILLNAIKYSNANGSIDVYYEENCIVIKDYGAGIAPEKMDKLFKERMHSSLGTQNEYGFGIGLYFCYRLMQKNNGTIIVENNSLNGSIFKIVFYSPPENAIDFG